MAATVSLVLMKDYTGDISSVSLLGGTAGFYLDQWMQAVSRQGDESVTDVLKMFGKGASQDALAAYMIAVEEYLRRAENANRSSARDSVWLRAKMTNETNARQTLIYGGGWADPLDIYGIEATGSLFPDLRLAIEHAPWWEYGAYVTYTYGNILVDGSMTLSSSTGYGSLPGRIRYMSFIGTSGAALTEFWGGFLTDEERTIANFVTPWELENGTMGTDAAVAGGNVVVTFVTTTLANRVTLTPYQISASNFADLRGTFNILMLASCSSGVTARARLSCGIGSSWMCNNFVTITGTSPKFYPMGQVTFPAGGHGLSDYDALRNTTMKIEAEQTVGSGTLSMDLLVPIPADYSFHIGGGSGNNTLALATNPFDVVLGYTYSGSYIAGCADISGSEARTVRCPKGNFRIILAGQRDAGVTKTDRANVELDVVPRFRTVRGAG